MSTPGEGGPLQARKEISPETESASTLILDQPPQLLCVFHFRPDFSPTAPFHQSAAIYASELSTGAPQPENASGLHADASSVRWSLESTAILGLNTFPGDLALSPEGK